MPRREVTLYGQRLDQVPVVGGFISSEKTMRRTANGLAIGRAMAGPAVAGYLLATSPENRTWKVALTVGAISATDRLDGDIARANMAAMTDEERAAYAAAGHEEFGKKVDHLADKAWVIPPMAALAMRGEISVAHPAAKIVRDRYVGKVKAARAEVGDDGYQSAIPLARWKASVEMLGVGVAASPVSAIVAPDGNTVTEHVFRAATTLSMVTAEQYVDDLTDALQRMNVPDIMELGIDGSGGEVVHE